MVNMDMRYIYMLWIIVASGNGLYYIFQFRKALMLGNEKEAIRLFMKAILMMMGILFFGYMLWRS